MIIFSSAKRVALQARLAKCAQKNSQTILDLIFLSTKNDEQKNDEQKNDEQKNDEQKNDEQKNDEQKNDEQEDEKKQ
jgi:mannitol-specific phosphotransferase system IIBC component